MSDTNSASSQDIAQQFLRRGQLIQYALAFLLLIILFWSFFNWWSTRDEPAIRDVDITTVDIISSTNLCPGDSLLVKISTHIEGEGNLTLNTTVQRMSPAKTVIFSDPLHFAVIGPIDQEYLIPWRVPERYRNFETGQTEPFVPGPYARIITLSGEGYRYVFSDLESINFTIKEDCNGPASDPVGNYGSSSLTDYLRSV